jgi:hypothetical protein
MTIVTFILGIILVAAGAAGLAASINLLPTELGLLYAACGVVLVSGGVITWAVGVAILRLEALTHVVRYAAALDGLPDEAGLAAALPHPDEMSAHEAEEDSEALAQEDEALDGEEPPLAEHAPLDEPVEEPSAEAQAETSAIAAAPPTVAELEQAIAASRAPPTLVGHYSAGGANYKIFSDGSIEAETAGGAFRFASMEDFKSYLASERA